MLGRGRLGTDVFLGEAVIALHELEEVPTDQPLDFHQYVLGRRSAKEKVRALSVMAAFIQCVLD